MRYHKHITTIRNRNCLISCIKYSPKLLKFKIAYNEQQSLKQYEGSKNDENLCMWIINSRVCNMSR